MIDPVPDLLGAQLRRLGVEPRLLERGTDALARQSEAVIVALDAAVDFGLFNLRSGDFSCATVSLRLKKAEEFRVLRRVLL